MRFPALLAPVLFTSLVFAATSRADEVDLGPPIPQDRLDNLRGGFDMPSGITAGFGFERTVTVNGQTVITQTVTIPDVSKITQEQVNQLTSLTQNKAVQIGGGSGSTTSNVATSNTSTTATTPTIATPVVNTPTIPAVPVVVTPTVPTTPSIPTIPTIPSTPAIAPAIAPTDNTALVPNAGTTVLPNTDIALIPNTGTSIVPNMGTLIIQNSLDGQTIQAMTTIHAAVNTLTLLQNIHFTQSLTDSLRLGGNP
ncbi:hypothetical protein DWG18_13140 [Lysobacter sp. TY2-98]|uniref:hypothetical protein n=1 Tax=Lysobacter sp. TY2-98 TaxID=2290922 RepID=UPI000E1FC16D|nr:hypothetical protein [Lysobacter sp. TY2-98]AXK73131.1 hypothetical protein DWG18_13140 [Lysobacter sp. TY2-98]